jgi:hypothetical protein
VHADEQGRPNLSLGTFVETDTTSSLMRRGLRYFYFERILSIVAKLTAIAEIYTVYSVNSFQLSILSISAL